MAKRRRRSPKAVQASIEEFKQKFDALENKRTTFTPQAIERRRHDVWEMMCQDIPQTEMANLLGVSRVTIAMDVKYWKKRLARKVGRIKEDPDYANIELGMTVKKLDSLTAAAFQEYSMSKSASEKAKFLDIANKTLSTKTRILQESGYLPKAGIEIRAKVEHEPTFAARFGPDSPLAELDNSTNRHKLLSLAQKILEQAEKKIIDVNGAVSRPATDEQPPPASDTSPVDNPPTIG